MKNLIRIAIILSITILATSCQKEYPYPSNEYPKSDRSKPQELSIYGKWKITDATMHIKNVVTGISKDSNLFTSSNIASMAQGNVGWAIDSLEKNVTTYTFKKGIGYGYGTFILNGDSIRTYELTCYSGQYTIIENGTTQSSDSTQVNNSTQLMGGSARPIISYRTVNYSGGILSMDINERRDSTLNFDYYTELTLEKIN